MRNLDIADTATNREPRAATGQRGAKVLVEHSILLGALPGRTTRSSGLRRGRPSRRTVVFVDGTWARRPRAGTASPSDSPGVVVHVVASGSTDEPKRIPAPHPSNRSGRDPPRGRCRPRNATGAGPPTTRSPRMNPARRRSPRQKRVLCRGARSSSLFMLCGLAFGGWYWSWIFFMIPGVL